MIGKTRHKAALSAIGIALCVALFADSDAAGAQGARPDLLERAAEAAAVCTEHMPDSRTARTVFKDSGFRYEGTDGQYHIYSLNGRRLIAGTTVTSSRQQGCIISVSKMTPAEATTLIGPWLEASDAKQVAPWRPNLGGAWEGRFAGVPIRLGVVNNADFGIMRGAAIVAMSGY